MPQARVLFLADVVTSYGRGVLHGVQRYVRAHTDWLLHIEHWETVWFERDLPASATQGVAGVLAQANNPKLHAALRQLNVPVVNLSNSLFEMDLPRVASDDEAVGRMAAEHFLSRGFTRFGFAGSYRYYALARANAFCATLARAGHTCRVLGCEPDPPPPELGEWLKATEKPLALFCSTDGRAGGAIDLCRALGLSVPHDVAILGVDNDDFVCSSAPVPLSSVELGLERIGREAGALLARLLAGETAPLRPLEIPPSGVVTRQSTDVYATPDGEVAAALRYIRQHANRGVTVDDVVAAVPIGRRSLEMRMKQAVGHGPHAEIVRARLEIACRLLSESTLRIGRIARDAGFTNPQHLSVVFRQHMGESPGTYRQRYRLKP